MDTSFFPFLNKQKRLVVGLMSGTSVDGIDAAVVEITGQGDNVSVNSLAFYNTPFDNDLRERIFKAFDPKNATIDVIGALNMELGAVYAKAALNAIKGANLNANDVDLICSHGQTIYHEPIAKGSTPAYTVQIGDGNVIAQHTGIACVSDFRVADIAAGGQGAPLVPFTEFLMYRSEEESVLLQNIGGIGNITILPKGCEASEVTAFDTGPGNMIIDALVSIITNEEQSMDIGGEIAAKGKANDTLLNELLSHPYFSAALPKTTGRELFGVEYTNDLYKRALDLGLCNEDIIATVTAFTSHSIAKAVTDFILPNIKATKLIVGGGGSYNKTMISLLSSLLSSHGVKVQTQEEIGHSSDAKEAIAFALLGDCTLRGIPSSMPSVTGAKYAPILGKLSFPTSKK